MSGNVALSFAHAFPSAFQKNAALFAAVGWRRSQRASLRCESPLLHVRLDEHEAHLTEVDVNVGWTIGADRREEVLTLEPVCHVLKSFAVASEENCAGPWAVSYAYHISLHEGRRVIGTVEGLVVSSLASRSVCNRIFV